MSFSEALANLRKARRIRTRGFEDVGIPSSYICGMEKGEFLPGPEKLEQLVTVFVNVAREQNSINPEEDRDILTLECQLSRFERIARKLTEELEGESRDELTEPMRETLQMLESLSTEQRVYFSGNILPDLIKGIPEAVAEEIRNIREETEPASPLTDREILKAHR